MATSSGPSHKQSKIVLTSQNDVKCFTTKVCISKIDPAAGFNKIRIDTLNIHQVIYVAYFNVLQHNTFDVCQSISQACVKVLGQGITSMYVSISVLC